ncbi:MAG: VOC family protein [Pseudomonadota bacterium]
MPAAMTQGLHHVGLTVRDLQESLRFFVEVLGFTKTDEKPGYPAAFINDGTNKISLWQAKDPETAQPFERKNTIGLHHLALAVAPERLDVLHQHLAATPGVEIEFAPERVGAGPGRHMMCTIPGGLRLEFIAPQPAA